MKLLPLERKANLLPNKKDCHFRLSAFCEQRALKLLIAGEGNQSVLVHPSKPPQKVDSVHHLAWEPWQFPNLLKLLICAETLSPRRRELALCKCLRRRCSRHCSSSDLRLPRLNDKALPSNWAMSLPALVAKPVVTKAAEESIKAAICRTRQ